MPDCADNVILHRNQSLYRMRSEKWCRSQQKCQRHIYLLRGRIASDALEKMNGFQKNQQDRGGHEDVCKQEHEKRLAVI